MITASVAFASATAVGAILTRGVRALALRHGAVDHALVSRKIHRRPVPRLGGIAIVLAFYAPLVALLFVRGDVGREFYADPWRPLALFAGGLAIAALGVYDDLKGSGAPLKLTVQLAVAAFMYWSGFRIDHIASPFGPAIELGIVSLPFTMFWIAGVINAMNLIDGLDGLAGGVAFVAAATTMIIAFARGETLMVLSSAALAGAILGFLFYNFHPASIFMGDTGSMFLGFVLATTAIHTNSRSSSTVAILVPIIALGLPIADTLLAMMRRAARGVPMFQGDRGHIHHRLLDRGLSHRQTVLALYATSAVLGASALFVAFHSSSRVLWFLLTLSVVAYVVLRRLGFINLNAAQTMIEQRRRNLMLRHVVRRAGEAVREAGSPEEIWKQVRRVARFMGATGVGLGIGADAAERLTYTHGFDVASLDLLRVRYGLTPERPGANFIELGWSDGRTRVERDTEIAIELLCHHVAPAVERLESGRGRAERRLLRLPG